MAGRWLFGWRKHFKGVASSMRKDGRKIDIGLDIPFMEFMVEETSISVLGQKS